MGTTLTNRNEVHAEITIHHEQQISVDLTGYNT
jgi:hypothetical protein